jgi:hypothetical protein
VEQCAQKYIGQKSTLREKQDTGEKLLRTESGIGYRLVSAQQD